MYKDFATVADGIGKQLEACISAVDQSQNGKKNPPAELEQLITKLTEAGDICGVIERKAQLEEDEPDPGEVAAAEMINAHSNTSPEEDFDLGSDQAIDSLL